MENNNEIFEFGNNINQEVEQSTDFDFNSINGLGESNYENEDLFNTEVEYSENIDAPSSYDDYYTLNDNNEFEIKTDDEEQQDQQVANDDTYEDDQNNLNEFELNQSYSNFVPENYIDTLDLDNSSQDEPVTTSYEIEKEELVPEDTVENIEQPIQESETIEEAVIEETPVNQEETITVSDTPIEELNKLTEYKEEEIEETDISSLFDKVSVNVKEASDIFRKNTDLKEKIDVRFNELKKLQSELENSRNKQLDEINNYKEEVVNKLTEKKTEIEKRLNLLKEAQANLEKEKQEFEKYKKEAQENIDKVQKQVQDAYDDRREELNHLEDVLRKQKDDLDEERNQLSLDKIQYESDKNELANNLLKFNELVNSFTNGMNDMKG